MNKNKLDFSSELKALEESTSDDTYCSDLKHNLLYLRIRCAKYPIRFLEEISGLNKSTINRFINGKDAKVSTVLALMECMVDNYAFSEDKYNSQKNKRR